MNSRKYTGKIRRKEVASFTDESPNTKKALCHYCFDNGIEINLVPYILNTGVTENNFMKCENCQAVISKLKMKYQGEVIALGSVQYGGKTAVFESVVSRRRSIKRATNSFEPTEDPIPLLAGKPDTELEALLKDRGGSITYIEDSNSDIEEEEQ